jgi:hypothetical protein
MVYLVLAYPEYGMHVLLVGAAWIVVVATVLYILAPRCIAAGSSRVAGKSSGRGVASPSSIMRQEPAKESASVCALARVLAPPTYSMSSFNSILQPARFFHL